MREINRQTLLTFQAVAKIVAVGRYGRGCYTVDVAEETGLNMQGAGCSLSAIVSRGWLDKRYKAKPSLGCWYDLTRKGQLESERRGL